MPSNKYTTYRYGTAKFALGAILLIAALCVLVAFRASAAGAAVHHNSLPGGGGGSPTCTFTNSWATSGTYHTSSFGFRTYSTIECNENNVKVSGSLDIQQWIQEGGGGQWQDTYIAGVIPGSSPATLTTAYQSTVTLIQNKACATPTLTTQTYRVSIDWVATFPDGTVEYFPQDIGPRGYECELNIYGP